MSDVVYRPQGPHSCDLPGGIETIGQDYRKGTVWRCDCGTTWVSQGVTGGGYQRSGGYAAGGLEWKRESKRARRKRERNTPFVFPARTAVAKRPTEPATPADPDPLGWLPPASTFHEVKRDADGLPTHLVLLDPRDVTVVTSPLTGLPNGYRYDPPCPAPSPADPVE